MSLKELKSRLSGTESDASIIAVHFDLHGITQVYRQSVNQHAGNYYFLGRNELVKSLHILVLDHATYQSEKFSCLESDTLEIEPGVILFRCALDHIRANAIREIFPFTRPQKIGRGNSFGFGDRLGMATPGHIRALRDYQLSPVFAQQSIRELERTSREPLEVIDAATWGVFQEGWREGYAADADHLKTTDDIDRMARAGFTMFTIDPGACVNSDAVNMNYASLYSCAQMLDWLTFSDTFDDILERYSDKSFAIGGYTFRADGETVLRALVKYGNVIIHVIHMHRHLSETWPGFESEIELSVDETDTPTSPFEHFFIASELRRRGIIPLSIAPRFRGDFEKGIDYRGDIYDFLDDYRRHAAIAETLGPYKLSLHSGSDKFSVYQSIGKLPQHGFHVKTAGTSYLVALETIARTAPTLFRDIFTFSRSHYETEKQSYHVSADLVKVPTVNGIRDSELPSLFADDDVRQVLHVAFGKVLTTRGDGDEYLFRSTILKVLSEHEELHYELLEKHFKRHLAPLTGG